ncbi:MAG: two pore domain potassium channel family protein [Betaproteobacteria bacterium]|nr:two pore domain potassium channel family protein [Betaproteobacteria bacterium]
MSRPGLSTPLADRALTILVALLVVDVFFLAPLVEMFGKNYLLADLVFTAVLVMGGLVIWGDLWITNIFVATGIISIGLRVANIWLPEADVRAWDAGFAIFNFGVLIWLVLRRVFRAGKINLHRVLGAVAVYLLVGLLFANIYRLIALGAPNAFLMLGQPASYEQIASHFTYFSFVALTTLGFGDITPVHPMAKSMTLLSSLVGTLYPAVLIGRLVSQELLHRNDD